MSENKEILDNHEVKAEPTGEQTVVHPAETKSDGLSRAVIGGVVGALVGTAAVALTNKKTSDNINRTVKGLGDAVKAKAEGFNDRVKSGIDAAKGVVPGFNNTIVNDLKNTVKGVAKDAKTSVKVTEDIIKDTVEDAKAFNNQDVKISDQQIFQLYEERLVANTKQVKTSEVAIGKHVETHIAHISVPLEKERVVIKQIPVDTETPIDPSEVDFSEGELVRMEIYEQTADIEKQAFVREQISVRKEVEYNTLEVEDKIRREELDLDVQGSNDINQTNNTLTQA